MPVSRHHSPRDLARLTHHSRTMQSSHDIQECHSANGPALTSFPTDRILAHIESPAK